MKKLLLILPLLVALSACDENQSTDKKVAAQQVAALAEAQSQVGMPAIVNFQEKRMMKSLYELRDGQIATHTYIVNQMQGCLVYIGASVGYGLPYATQYSNPEVDTFYTSNNLEHTTMPQAEPNGLFMPSSAQGTWVMLKDPEGTAVKPVYIEPEVMVVPFRIKAKECK